MKNKLVTGLVAAATIILAGVAIFTAIRLYQLRQEPVAPTVPESKPKATGVPKACTQLSFTIAGPTATPTPTSTPKPSPTPTTPGVGGGPSPTPTLTPTPTPTQPPGATSTPTPTTGQIAQASPTPAGQAGGAGAQLPAAGISLPTILIMGVGILLIIGAVLLAI